MVERVLCKHEVVGSNPSGSTIGDAPMRFSDRCIQVSRLALIHEGRGWCVIDIVKGRVGPLEGPPDEDII